jgi:hypothetical protein
MPMTYHDKQRATVRLGHALAGRGWKLWGYHEDQSESYSDYYHPASWDGVATHPDLPGYVIGVNVCQYDARKSGQPDSKGVSVPAETCPRCNGACADPSGWTLAQARQSPREWHLAYAELEGMKGARALFPDVVSPIPFFDGGALKCRKCYGKGHLTRIETVALPTWPVFQATPRGKMWHVEFDGQVIASGTGFNRCYHNVEREAKAGVEVVVNAILTAINKHSASRIAAGVEEINAHLSETGQEKSAAGSTVYTVEQERDWTWIKFPNRPTNDILEALRGNLDARWSKKRAGWYITRPLSAAEVAAALGA